MSFVRSPYKRASSDKRRVELTGRRVKGNSETLASAMTSKTKLQLRDLMPQDVAGIWQERADFLMKKKISFMRQRWTTSNTWNVDQNPFFPLNKFDKSVIVAEQTPIWPLSHWALDQPWPCHMGQMVVLQAIRMMFPHVSCLIRIASNEDSGDTSILKGPPFPPKSWKSKIGASKMCFLSHFPPRPWSWEKGRYSF